MRVVLLVAAFSLALLCLVSAGRTYTVVRHGQLIMRKRHRKRDCSKRDPEDLPEVPEFGEPPFPPAPEDLANPGDGGDDDGEEAIAAEESEEGSAQNEEEEEEEGGSNNDKGGGGSNGKSDEEGGSNGKNDEEGGGKDDEEGKDNEESGSQGGGGGGETFTGKATFFTPDVGACGKPNTEDDLIAAMNAPQYGDGDNPNDAEVCGKCVEIEGPLGKVTVTIADMCPPCEHGDLDLSPAAFNQIGKKDDGIVDITWSFVECSGGG